MTKKQRIYLAFALGMMYLNVPHQMSTHWLDLLAVFVVAACLSLFISAKSEHS